MDCRGAQGFGPKSGRDRSGSRVSGTGNVVAIAYSVLLFLAGMTDNVLKPLLLGRGVDAPMPVILLGALGGMGTGGILGMFVGARCWRWANRYSWVGWRTGRPERVSRHRAIPLQRIDATAPADWMLASQIVAARRKRSGCHCGWESCSNTWRRW